MIKKISNADAEFILNKKISTVQRIVYEYTLINTAGGRGYFILQSRIRAFWFYLMILPIAICQFIYCLLDGGLKEFRLMSNRDRIVYNKCECSNSIENSTYQRMKKIWEKA